MTSNNKNRFPPKVSEQKACFSVAAFRVRNIGFFLGFRIYIQGRGLHCFENNTIRILAKWTINFTNILI